MFDLTNLVLYLIFSRATLPPCGADYPSYPCVGGAAHVATPPRAMPLLPAAAAVAARSGARLFLLAKPAATAAGRTRSTIAVHSA